MLRRPLLVVGLAAVFALPAAAQTVDELIARNINARGGMEKLKATTSLRYTGRMVAGPGMEAPIVMEQKRPNRMRMELAMAGMTVVQAFDGTLGWTIMPAAGKADPQPMTEGDVKTIANAADFDGPLVDYKEKGHQIELVGKESVGDRAAYKLKLVLKNGRTQHLYLDADTYLEIKSETKQTLEGTEMDGETIFGDYKEVGGRMMAHSIEAGLKGAAQTQKITIEKVEINPVIDDARFKMPEIKKPEAKP